MVRIRLYIVISDDFFTRTVSRPGSIHIFGVGFPAENKKIILVAQCLINPYCRVHVLGQNFPLSHELMDYLMKLRVGIIQYACPETTAMGLQRNPQGRQQYDNMFFRNHCKELLQPPFLMVEEFLRNGYRLVAYIGLYNSPTCGIHWGKQKVNSYHTE